MTTSLRIKSTVLAVATAAAVLVPAAANAAAVHPAKPPRPHTLAWECQHGFVSPITCRRALLRDWLITHLAYLEQQAQQG